MEWQATGAACSMTYFFYFMGFDGEVCHLVRREIASVGEGFRVEVMFEGLDKNLRGRGRGAMYAGCHPVV